MHVGSNFGGSHILLFGGGAAQAANDRLTMGAETRDLFDRPISSAQAIMDGVTEAFPENAKGPAARSGTPDGTGDSTPQVDYDEWIDKMVAFRKAASLGAGTTATGANTVEEGVQDGAAHGVPDAGTQDGGTTPANAGQSGGTGSTGGTASANDGGTDTGTDSGGSTGTGGTGAGSGSGNSGGGLLGGVAGLFGWG